MAKVITVCRRAMPVRIIAKKTRDEKDAADAAIEAFRALGTNDLTQEHVVQLTTGENIINTMPGYFKSKNIFGMKQSASFLLTWGWRDMTSCWPELPMSVP